MSSIGDSKIGRPRLTTSKKAREFRRCTCWKDLVCRAQSPSGYVLSMKYISRGRNPRHQTGPTLYHRLQLDQYINRSSPAFVPALESSSGSSEGKGLRAAGDMQPHPHLPALVLQDAGGTTVGARASPQLTPHSQVCSAIQLVHRQIRQYLHGCAYSLLQLAA